MHAHPANLLLADSRWADQQRSKIKCCHFSQEWELWNQLTKSHSIHLEQISLYLNREDSQGFVNERGCRQ
jgi:hypothetical protein